MPWQLATGLTMYVCCAEPLTDLARASAMSCACEGSEHPASKVKTEKEIPRRFFFGTNEKAWNRRAPPAGPCASIYNVP